MKLRNGVTYYSYSNGVLERICAAHSWMGLDNQVVSENYWSALQKEAEQISEESYNRIKRLVVKKIIGIG